MTTEAESTSSVFSFSALIIVLLFAVGVLMLVYFTWYRPSHDTSSTYIERNSTVTTPGETNPAPDTNTENNINVNPPREAAPTPEPGNSPNADTGSQGAPSGEPAPAQ